MINCINDLECCLNCRVFRSNQGQWIDIGQRQQRRAKVSGQQWNAVGADLPRAQVNGHSDGVLVETAAHSAPLDGIAKEHC